MELTHVKATYGFAVTVMVNSFKSTNCIQTIATGYDRDKAVRMYAHDCTIGIWKTKKT